MQLLGDSETGIVKSSLSDLTKNMLDISEVIISINSLFSSNKGYKDQTGCLAKFNAKMSDINHWFRRRIIELLEDLKDDLNKIGQTVFPEIQAVGGVLKQMSGKEFSQLQLMGQLFEIGLSCHPELTGLTTRIDYERSLIMGLRKEMGCFGGAGGGSATGLNCSEVMKANVGQNGQIGQSGVIEGNGKQGRVQAAGGDAGTLVGQDSQIFTTQTQDFDQLNSQNKRKAPSERQYRKEPCTRSNSERVLYRAKKGSRFPQNPQDDLKNSLVNQTDRIQSEAQFSSPPPKSKRKGMRQCSSVYFNDVRRNKKPKTQNLNFQHLIGATPPRTTINMKREESRHSSQVTSSDLVPNTEMSFYIDNKSMGFNNHILGPDGDASTDFGGAVDPGKLYQPFKFNHAVDPKNKTEKKYPFQKPENTPTKSKSKRSVAAQPPQDPPYAPPKAYKKPEIIEIVQKKQTEKTLINQQALSRISSIAALSHPTLKRSLSKDIDFNEKSTTKISNKTSFFAKFNTTKFNISDLLANKLDFDFQTSQLYLTGLNGTLVANCSGANISVSNIIQKVKSSTVKTLPFNRIILQDCRTNDLRLAALGLGGLSTLATLKGAEDVQGGVEDLHCYRSSVDNYFFLWRSGLDSLTIVDLDSFQKVEILQKFWSFRGMSTQPLAACADRAAERILALSYSTEYESFVVNYFEDSQTNACYFSETLQKVLPCLRTASCLEISALEKVVYVAGLSSRSHQNDGACVLVIDFNDSLKQKATHFLTDLNYGVPHRMKRIRGTEILIVGCDRHFAILEFQASKIVQLGAVPSVHKHQICDFVLAGRYLYSKGLNEDYLSITEFMGGSSQDASSIRFSMTDLNLKRKATGRDRDSNRSLRTVIKVPKDLESSSFNNSRYSNFWQTKITAKGMKCLEKVTTSVDGMKLYAGGNGLHLFKFEDGAFKAANIDSSGHTNFFSVRATNSGDVVIQEPVSNNMIVLTGNSFQVITVLKGKQRCVFNTTYLRNPHFIGEDNTVVWFCGTSSIAIVDFNNIKPVYIDNLIPYYDSRNFGVATRCVAKDQGSSIFVVYVMNNLFYISAFFKGKKPIMKKVREFLREFNKLYAIELNLSRSVIFCAGCSKRDDRKKTKGTLAAVRFDSGLGVISEVTLGRYNAQVCSSLRRFKDRDDLVVGCMRALLIVEFTGKQFLVKNVVRDLHSYSITDIWVFGNRIFTVCRKDDHISEIAYDYQ